jgi:hypothetical protein
MYIHPLQAIGRPSAIIILDDIPPVDFLGHRRLRNCQFEFGEHLC